MATATAFFALIAVFRYAGEQRWKRQQAIFDYLDGWLKTPGAHNASRMLQEPSREVPLWDFGAPERRWTIVSWDDIAAAYWRDPLGQLPSDPGYTAIRDSFGDFFHRLSRLESMLEQGLIEESDARFVMQHWVNIFRDQRDEPHIRNIRETVFKHKTNRMPKLFRRFGLDITKGEPAVAVAPRKKRFAPES